MRIQGRWGRYDAPYVAVHLICEELSISKEVEFLIDTGASATNILDNDAIRLRIDHSKLRKAGTNAMGIGGEVTTYILPQAKLVFKEEEGPHELLLDRIFVLEHEVEDPGTRERIKNIPSLLGRDVINRFKLFLDGENDQVLLTDERLQTVKRSGGGCEG